MKPLRISGLLVITLSAIVSTANAQSSAKLVAGNGTIEMSRGSGWSIIGSTDQILPKDRIRTGVGSFATLELGPGKGIVLGDQTEIALPQLGSSPTVVLASGALKVVSDSDIRVDAKGSVLESAGEPFEMDVIERSGKFNLIVLKGAVRSGAIIIRPAGDSASRTYTTGSFRQRFGPTVVPPTVYIYPYAGYAAPDPCAALYPGYAPGQIIPPMTDPLRPPVHYPVNPFPYRPPKD